MQLVNVYVIGLETVQTLLTGLGEALADRCFIWCSSVDTLIGIDFRSHDPPVAPPLEGLANDGFTMAIAVGCGRVEQVDTQLFTAVHEGNELSILRPAPSELRPIRLGDHAPKGHGTEPYLGNLQPCLS